MIPSCPQDPACEMCSALWSEISMNESSSSKVGRVRVGEGFKELWVVWGSVGGLVY